MPLRIGASSICPKSGPCCPAQRLKDLVPEAAVSPWVLPIVLCSSQASVKLLHFKSEHNLWRGGGGVDAFAAQQWLQG